MPTGQARSMTKLGNASNVIEAYMGGRLDWPTCTDNYSHFMSEKLRYLAQTIFSNCLSFWGFSIRTAKTFQFMDLW